MGNVHVRINYLKLAKLLQDMKEELDKGALHQEPVCMREDCPNRIKENSEDSN